MYMSIRAKESLASAHEGHIEVMLVWGGTGECKEAEVGLDETAGQVFDHVFARFHQPKSDRDSFEVDGRDFSRSRFGETVRSLVRQYGKDLEFEVIPPSSGA